MGRLMILMLMGRLLLLLLLLLAHNHIRRHRHTLPAIHTPTTRWRHAGRRWAWKRHIQHTPRSSVPARRRRLLARRHKQPSQANRSSREGRRLLALRLLFRPLTLLQTLPLKLFSHQLSEWVRHRPLLMALGMPGTSQGVCRTVPRRQNIAKHARITQIPASILLLENALLFRRGVKVVLQRPAQGRVAIDRAQVTKEGKLRHVVRCFRRLLLRLR